MTNIIKITMNICDICNKLCKNLPGLISHRRWHDLPENEYVQQSIINANLGNKRAFGYKHKSTAKSQISLKNTGSGNGLWKSNNVGLRALHEWVERHKIKPNSCQDCGKITEKLDLANISQQYKRDVDDYEYICRSCHMKKDGRLKRMNKIRLEKCEKPEDVRRYT
jgi:hypothetical protein